MVTFEHVRAVGYCAAGCRDYCLRHGLDFKELASVGLPIEVLEKIDDGFVRRIVEEARRGG